MANQDGDLAACIMEARGVENLQADNATLHEIRSFLQSREAESIKTASHTVLENYPDWWVRNRRAPPGLEIDTQEDLETLYRHAGYLFSLGVPLTLAERRTGAFRFFQDLEAWGTREATIAAEELLSPDAEITQLLGSLVAEVFPSHGGFLDAAVYDATGLSQTRGLRKTSLRLVWPGVVVDADRAARVRDLLVHRLTSAAAEGGPIADLQARLTELSPANAWHSVFGDAAYSGRSHVRLPLSDRVAPLPLRAPERRPLVPIGVLRFVFGGEGKMKVEWLCRRAELEDPEWIKIGSLRQPSDTPLTEWSVPSWPGNQPIPPSSTRTGRVKVRTAGGSDGGGGLRLRATNRAPAPERAGQLLTVERKFNGEPAQFCEKMEQHLGKPTVEADGGYVWKQPNGDARIVMYAEDKRVLVVGRPNQVRSLVVIVAPYTEAQPGLSGSPPSWQGPGLHSEGRMPSAAYAPADAGTSGGAAPLQAVDRDRSELAVAEPAGQLRQAEQDFEAEGAGELGLTRFEVVCITNDPEENDAAASEDRWVYGRSTSSGLCGWFPLSHTTPFEETSRATA